MPSKHKVKASITTDGDLPDKLQKKLKKMDKITRLEKALDYLLSNVQFYGITQDRFKQDSEYLFTVAIPDEMMPLIEKIETRSKTLGQICDGDITEGDTKRKEERHVINVKDYKELSESEKQTYKEVLKGVNVKRYIVEWGNLYIKNLSETSKDHRLLIKDYSKRLRVAYEGNRFRCLRTIYCAYPKDSSISPKYLMGLLNSTLLHFYYLAHFYTSRPGKGSFRFRKQFLKRLPIKYADTTIPEEIVRKVDRIISLKKETSNLKHKMNQFPNSYLKDNWSFQKLVHSVRTQSLSKSSYVISDKNVRSDYFRDLGDNEVFRIILRSDEYLDFTSENVASYVFEVLKTYERITKRELLELRIPKEPRLKNLLTQCKEDKKKVAKNKKTVKELEKQIDDLVYKLYDITYKERKIIEEYLAKF